MEKESVAKWIRSAGDMLVRPRHGFVTHSCRAVTTDLLPSNRDEKHAIYAWRTQYTAVMSFSQTFVRGSPLHGELVVMQRVTCSHIHAGSRAVQARSDFGQRILIDLVGALVADEPVRQPRGIQLLPMNPHTIAIGNRVARTNH